jgi:hypothetical protein
MMPTKTPVRGLTSVVLMVFPRSSTPQQHAAESAGREIPMLDGHCQAGTAERRLTVTGRP